MQPPVLWHIQLSHYPADPAERARALELEDFFDEQLAPAVRTFGWYHARCRTASSWARRSTRTTHTGEARG